MAHKTQNTQTDIMVETKGKLELFFDKYGNKILWTLAIVAIAFGAYFIYKSYADGKEREKAQKADVALANALVEDTAEAYAGVVAEYAESAAANTAAWMAGARYLEVNDLENAKTYLAMYNNVGGVAGTVVDAKVAIALGDIAVEEDRMEDAIAHFRSAVDGCENANVYGMAVEELARVYEHLGMDAEAQALYEEASAKFDSCKAMFENRIRE